MSIQSKLLKILLPKRNLGNLKIGEEDRMCIEFANYLRQLTLHSEGSKRKDKELTFPYLWRHNPNQFGSYKWAFGLKQGWMGRIPGVPDFSFETKGHSFNIEFKTSKGKLSPDQEIYHEWAKECGIEVFICRSFEEAKKIIESL